MDIPLLDANSDLGGSGGNGRRLSGPHQQTVEILFKDVRYTLNKGEGPKREKPILKGVSGAIYAGKVSAIFGPTGK